MSIPARRARPVVVAALLLLVPAVAACAGDGSGDTGSTGSVPGDGSSTTDTTSPFTVPGGGRYDYDESAVTIGTSPYEVPGTLRIPEGVSGDEPVPGAIVVGDFGPQDEDGTVLARKPLRDLGQGLAERGVATITYAKRTHTHQDELVDDPAVGIEADVLDDAVSALQVLRDAPGVDPAHLYVVGHGFGGSLSPRIAAEAAEGGGVAGLVALAAPSRPMQRVLVDEARYLAELDGAVDEEEQGRLALVEEQASRVESPDLSPDVPPGDALGAAGRWWIDQRGYDPADAAGHAQLPVLVVMAGRDHRAGAADVEGWRVATDLSGLVQLEVVDDLDHHLAAGDGPSSNDDYATAGKVDPRVLDAIVAFIESPPD